MYKAFGELSSQKQRLRRTKKLMKAINTWVEKEQFPLNKLLGFSGYSKNYLENKNPARIFKKIWQGNDVELKQEVPIESAIFVKENGLITKRAYADMRLTLKPFVLLPTYNSISSYIKQIMPEWRTVNDGIAVKVIDVAKSTITRLPNDVIDIMSEKVQNDGTIVLKLRFLLVWMEVEVSHYVIASLF